MISSLTRLLVCISLLSLLSPAGQAASWRVNDAANTEGPGRRVDVREGDTLRASLIYGEGQMKPFLHVYGEENELLTNAGLDRNGKTTGRFPHHRGIFIGWKINSELGTHDLWHMTQGTRMEVVQVETVRADADGAAIKARVEWHAPRKAGSDETLLLTETRTLTFSRPKDGTTQIDARFSLLPARDLKLEGDLQHSGIHFRASNEVATREKETSYLHDPEQVDGEDLKWCRLLFPIGDHWYTAQEINAPSNPVQQLSTRAYGRFGYFFKKPLMKGENLDLDYRFVISRVAGMAGKTKPSAEQTEQSRTECEYNYNAFVKTLTKK